LVGSLVGSLAGKELVGGLVGGLVSGLLGRAQRRGLRENSIYFWEPILWLCRVRTGLLDIPTSGFVSKSSRFDFMYI